MRIQTAAKADPAGLADNVLIEQQQLAVGMVIAFKV